MRFTPANVLNGIALAGVATILGSQFFIADPEPGIDPITTSSVSKTSAPTAHKANRYMVVDHNASQTCLFDLHRAEGYDVHRVEPASNCDGLSNRIADARAWKEMANSTITITDRAGRPILKLGPSDGFAYEVIEPAGMQLSLEAL
ncbi:MAG: AprI/Inh family metalloprotease inhibitor [Pseudomonadota bacterium]